MSRIKSWILGGCAASSLFALGASMPETPDTSRFSVTITPMSDTARHTAQGVPIVPLSVYQPEALSYPRDAIAAAGEAP